MYKCVELLKSLIGFTGGVLDSQLNYIKQWFSI